MESHPQAIVPMPILRLAYIALFLIALLSVFTLWGQVGGQVSDIEIQANEILKDRQRLNEILAFHTGQPVDKIAEATERDRYLSAVEAKEFGLVDDVLSKLADEKKDKPH